VPARSANLRLHFLGPSRPPAANEGGLRELPTLGSPLDLDLGSRDRPRHSPRSVRTRTRTARRPTNRALATVADAATWSEVSDCPTLHRPHGQAPDGQRSGAR
jgi:hypothetical protein